MTDAVVEARMDHVTLFPAVFPEHIPDLLASDYRGMSSRDSYPAWGPMKDGEIACAVAHIKLLERIMMDHIGPDDFTVAVFEDDVVFLGTDDDLEAMGRSMPKECNCGFIFLNEYEQWVPGAPQVVDGDWVQLRQGCYGLWGVIWRRAGIEAYLKLTKCLRPADHWTRYYCAELKVWTRKRDKCFCRLRGGNLPSLIDNRKGVEISAGVPEAGALE